MSDVSKQANALIREHMDQTAPRLKKLIFEELGLDLTNEAIKSRKKWMRQREKELAEKNAATPKELLDAERKQNVYATSAKSEKKKLKQALAELEDTEKELQALAEIKSHRSSFTIRAKKRVGGEATALWLASDWHVCERVTSGQTNGINEYDPDIAKARAIQFFQNGLLLTNMAARDVKIDTILLGLLGDFITGHLHLDAVETNYKPPVEEAVFAQELLVSGIKYILANSDYKLVIPCLSGNHGRTTQKYHFGSENGHSLEYFIYVSMAQIFENEPRVEFIIPEGAHVYVDVYGYQIRFLHGHDVRYNGGSGGLTIPLNKAIGQWDKARPAYLTCLGHFHQLFDGGNFLVNGSLIGYNAFALSIKAAAERPQQRFALIDRQRGKTLTAPILVDEE